MEDFQTEADDNNNIDYFAFVRIISKFRNSTNSDDELINELRKYDRDKSGLVSLADLRYVMMNMYDKLIEEEIDELITDLDLHITYGYICYEELAKLFKCL